MFCPCRALDELFQRIRRNKERKTRIQHFVKTTTLLQNKKKDCHQDIGDNHGKQHERYYNLNCFFYPRSITY